MAQASKKRDSDLIEPLDSGGSPASSSAPDRRNRRPLVHRGVEIVCSTRFEDAARAEGFLAIAGLDDSKRLTVLQREGQAERIRARALAVAIGSADHVEIDRLNILCATHLAMRRALTRLEAALDLVLIDGHAELPGLGVRQRPIVKGDALSVSIAAASIVAKVHRDALMRECDVRYPGYGLSHNMGYASDDHRDALRRLGPSEIHRRSFNGTQPWLF